MATRAGGFALGFVEPAEEVEAVGGGETRFGFREILLHAGEHGMPDDDIDRRLGGLARFVAGGAPEGFLQDARQHRAAG